MGIHIRIFRGILWMTVVIFQIPFAPLKTVLFVGKSCKVCSDHVTHFFDFDREASIRQINKQVRIC
jgi:hypothetical protein